MKNKGRRLFFVLWAASTAAAFFCIAGLGPTEESDSLLSYFFLFPVKILDLLSGHQVLYGFSAPFFLINSAVVALCALGLIRGIQFFTGKNGRRRFTTT